MLEWFVHFVFCSLRNRMLNSFFFFNETTKNKLRLPRKN